MRCTNCGATIPRDAGACPECGVFARVLERPQTHRRGRRWLIALLVVVVAAAAAYFVLRTPGDQPRRTTSIRVVHDRPGVTRVGAGATISEAEAILRLRRSLNLAPDCVAILSHGFHDGGYDLAAVDRCEGTKLGRWRVDGRSGAVTRP